MQGTQLPYLRTAIRVATDSAAGLQEALSPLPQPRALFEHDADRVRSVTFAEIASPTCRLAYTEMHGTLCNISTAVGQELVLGVITRGACLLRVNGQDHRLGNGQGILILPGDAALQIFANASLFTLRIPLGGGPLIRIRAFPFRQLRTVRRTLPPAVALDMLRLCQFTALEHDRSAGPDHELPVQSTVLLGAIRRRALRYLADLLPAPPTRDESMLPICIDADRFVHLHLDRKLTIAQLADASSCSVRQLYRAFETIAQTTPLEYQRRVRLNLARSLLYAGRSNHMPEILVRAGLTDARRFIRAYAAEFGETPQQTLEDRDRNVRELVGRSTLD